MTRMIRCIEGHVFDIDAQGKCPQCGWEPSARKETAAPAASASPFAFVGAFFGALIAAVEKLLGAAGLRDKPGLAGGIVYAGVILLAVGGALALGGAFRGGSAPSANTPANAPTNVNLQPQQKQAPQTPAPQQQVQPQQQAQPQPPQQQQGQSEQGGPGAGQQQQVPPQQQQVAPRYHPQPYIHVPGEVRQLLRRIF